MEGDPSGEAERRCVLRRETASESTVIKDRFLSPSSVIFRPPPCHPKQCEVAEIEGTYWSTKSSLTRLFSVTTAV